jgi:hypothetical protein
MDAGASRGGAGSGGARRRFTETDVADVERGEHGDEHGGKQCDEQY